MLSMEWAESPVRHSTFMVVTIGFRQRRSASTAMKDGTFRTGGTQLRKLEFLRSCSARNWTRGWSGPLQRWTGRYERRRRCIDYRFDAVRHRRDFRVVWSTGKRGRGLGFNRRRFDHRG